jgi:L-alanine-DL-glutamate epimerase-like enolase superfamily enzyme
MRYVDGHAIVPEGPGIGVALDKEAIKTFLVREFEIF